MAILNLFSFFCEHILSNQKSRKDIFGFRLVCIKKNPINRMFLKKSCILSCLSKFDKKKGVDRTVT